MARRGAAGVARAARRTPRGGGERVGREGGAGARRAPMRSSWKVALSSGCVTCAFLKRSAAGRTKRSNFGGLRVKDSPTKETWPAGGAAGEGTGREARRRM